MDLNITDIVARNYKEDKPLIRYSTFLKRKIKEKGKEPYFKYHDFSTGKEYDREEDVAALGDCFIIDKYAAADTIKEINGSKLYIRATKASYWSGVCYNVVKFEGVKLLGVYIVQLDIRATLNSKNEIRDWKTIARFYVDENKKAYCDGDFSWGMYIGSWNCYDYKELSPKHSWWNMQNVNLLKINDWYSEDYDLKSVLDKMGWGVVTLGANNRMILKSAWRVQEFLKYKEPSKKKGPKQVHIDMLTSLELEEIKVPEFKPINKKLKGWDQEESLSAQNFANISKVDNGDIPTCCYRTFIRMSDGSYSEGARIYIEPNGKFTACKPNNIGDWVNLSLSSDNSNFGYKLNYVNKEATKGTVLEYIIPMLKGKNGKFVGALIAAILRHPCIEKLYKIGFEDAILDLAKNSYGNLWQAIIDTLGGINEKGKNAYAVLGLNKTQVQVLNEIIKNNVLGEKSGFNNYSIYGIVKRCFTKTNLSDIDIETFKEMTDLVVDALLYENEVYLHGIVDSKGDKHSSWWLANASNAFHIMNMISRYFPLTTVKSMIPKIKELNHVFQESPTQRYDWQTRGYKEAISIIRPIDTYKSYLEMMDMMPERRGFSPHFQNIEHIRVMHDDILPVFQYYRDLERAKANEAKLEEMKESWNRCKKSWSKWEYENDFHDYKIIYPEEPYSLTVEGSALGHCVGGYIQKVLKRNTNILFLRKKDNLDKPFFTIEILNNGSVEQIHGQYNCNISDAKVMAEEPKLVEFVNMWAKEKELKLHSINKVR